MDTLETILNTNEFVNQDQVDPDLQKKISTSNSRKLDSIQWSSPDSERINNLINKYREGDSESGGSLLVLFTPLLNKYKAVLWYGKTARGGDIGRFLSFFGKDKRQVTELLNKSLKVYSEGEIDALLKYSLLQTALKYNKISSCYKYTLKSEIAALTKDTLTHRTTLHMDMQAEYDCHKLFQDYNTKITAEKTESDMCSEFVLEGSEKIGFKDLNETERKVVTLLYLDKYRIEQVAKMLNTDCQTIKTLKKSILNKLSVLRPQNER